MIHDTSHSSKGEVWRVGPDLWGHHCHDHWLCLGGWTTSGTTQRMGDEAVLAARAAICVAQFMKDPNHQEQLQALEKVSTYQRSTFIEQGGWDKMPGEERAGSTVARACADGLEVLMKK
jgi:hypothetical protein